MDNSDDPRIGNVIVDVANIHPRAECVCVILGVPQHIGVERNGGRAGAEQAPSMIRSALHRLTISEIEDVVNSGRLVIADGGNVDCDGKTLEQIHDEQYDAVVMVIKRGWIPIVLGGGHDVAWPTIRAMESTQSSYSAVNIDAHADVRPLIDEAKAHSGSPFRQMLSIEDSHLLAGGFVEFGLQEQHVSAAHLRYLSDKGMHAFTLREIRSRGINVAWSNALQIISGAEGLYVSLDMDSIASAFAPGVSAPAGDGFAPADVAEIVRSAASSGILKAFDVVEVNPLYDVDGRTAKIAALMISNVLSGLAATLR